MTADAREAIRSLVDERKRERLYRAGVLGACKGCGGALDCRTLGCDTCWDRHIRRTRVVTSHGTARGYKDGCRCDDCRQAATAAKARWREARRAARV